MEIKSVELNDDGSRDVVAHLEDDEVQFLLEFAINQLLAAGVTPFLQNPPIDKITFEAPETTQ